MSFEAPQYKNSASVGRALVLMARERKANPRQVWGIPWGLNSKSGRVGGLDKLTGGIQRHEMSVLMARPGVGKTALLAQVTQSVAGWLRDIDTHADANERKRYAGKRAKLVLCEMTAEQFQGRLQAFIANVSERRIREGRVTEEMLYRYEMAADTLRDLPIDYLDNPVSIEDTEKFLRAGDDCAWFAVDYIGIHPVGPRASGASTTQSLNFLSASFRRMCKEIAPGLVLAQMNREVEHREDTRPRLSDLKDSGQIEADAANVFALHRDDVFQRIPDHERNQPKRATLHVLKQRSGPLGDIPLLWAPTRGRFQDISQVHEDAASDTRDGAPDEDENEAAT